MLSTPTAGINMQNRTARLISLAGSVAGFFCRGILATIVGWDAGLEKSSVPVVRHLSF